MQSELNGSNLFGTNAYQQFPFISDASLGRSALDHRPGALPILTGRTELPSLAVQGAKKMAVLVALDPGLILGQAQEVPHGP